MKFLLFFVCLLEIPLYSSESFFQASHHQPYHLSIGAVLFNENGEIACHHFQNIFGVKDLYILMRESMENDETILMTLARGLKEEFGAEAIPLAFLGCLKGFLWDPRLSFEKTTLYIACQVTEWNPDSRKLDDPEAISTIEWHKPEVLIEIMQAQGKRFHRVDVDESEMIKRALEFIPMPNN